MVKGDTLWCKPTPLMTLPAMYADLQCRVCEVVEHPSVCLSVCLSHHLTAGLACGGFGAERRTDRRMIAAR